MSLIDLSEMLRPWYLSRGSGLVALVVLWLSVVLGLLQSSGMLRGLTSPGANIGLHDYTAVLGLYLSLFHGLILVFDPHTRFTVAEVLLPLASTYKTGETTLGIVAFYLFAIATVTTYLRQRMTPYTWRAIHLFTLVGFLGAQIHGWLMGTDSGQLFYLYSFTGVSVLALTLCRAWIWARNHAAGGLF